MKYFSKYQILESLARISNVNQFFGLTFLAAKQANLPIGNTMMISLDTINHKFLERYYKLDPRSNWYFRVFRFNNKEQYWVKPDYAGKGLQKLNTTSFKEAFIHDYKSKSWGWNNDYVDFLSTKLTFNEKISAFHFAVWFFRSKPIEDDFSWKEVINMFFSEFNITEIEQQHLFSSSYETTVEPESVFCETPVQWNEIVKEFDTAPDIGPDRGGILSYLELSGVGPVSPLIFEPGERLNIITGDNGLGKTFLLETAWWVLTGSWSNRQALPNMTANGQRSKATIKYSIQGKSSGKPQSIVYSVNENKWPVPEKRLAISGLVIFAQVDGSFAIWDPAWQNPETNTSLFFTKDEVWEGKTGRIEGLIRDWTKWQDKPDKYPFEIFQRLIQRMAPPEMGSLEISAPTRIPFDSREIPTIKHSYGDIPIVHESAGIRRILTLAYLIVWVWNEHKIISEQFSKKIEKRIVILIDEIEAHLHPKWQRTILPALLDTSSILGSEVEIQLIIASHSPLVLASSETYFTPDTDKLFHLDVQRNGNVKFDQINFVKYGRINSWLTSPMFKMAEPMSNEGQNAIQRAIALQKRKDVSKQEVEEVSNLLIDSLSSEDSFWTRWIFYAKKFGVEL
jgi:hypothetical protein